MFNVSRNKSMPLTPPSSSESDYSREHDSKENKNIGKCSSSPRKFTQLKYNHELYKSELKIHNQSLAEYDYDIYDNMAEAIRNARPNIDLYKQQPYLTFPIRQKLVDFLLKISIRLKILPFVFYKAVKLFDRYCSKRIVLLDQAQLIITTCLWIASKVQGGNNHFVNLSNLDKVSTIRTINDIGYGSGGKYLGPTERFRLPKLHELVKLCGAKCSYDAGMFKQMEVHILNTLEWSLNDPAIEEFIVESHEFSTMTPPCEIFKVKVFLSYVASYSHELIDVHVVDLAQVILDLINETFKLTPEDPNYQTVLNSPTPIVMELEKYKKIKKSLVKAILDSSEYILKLFNSRGPQFMYHQVINHYKMSFSPQMPITPVSPETCTGFPEPQSTPHQHQQFKPRRVVTPPEIEVSSPPIRNANHKIVTPTSTYPPAIIKGIPPPHQLPYYFHSPIEQPPSHKYKWGNRTPKQRSYSSSSIKFNTTNLSQGSLSSIASKPDSTFDAENPNFTPASETQSPVWLIKKQQRTRPTAHVHTQSVSF